MRMLPWTLLALLSLAAPLSARADDVDLSFYLPSDVRYDPAIPTPESVLGFSVGEWHVRHDQLVRYFEVLAAASERMSLKVTGQTWEQRSLLQAVFTSPENQSQLETVRRRHVEAVNRGDAPDADRPVVVWMGYSVHGNEPSGSNASLLMAYYLAAAQGPAIDEMLANTVVIMDPSINPDGLARFASWVNMHKGQQLVSQAQHREHQETWPGGRTNHYWFDLNRDWLLLTHPSSQARVREFHRWKPNVLTDHHEMGTGSTYFFQPGVPSRTNPRTPSRNQQLTAAIAEHHAAALDKLGSLYYSQESFDDFYYGKGSTYPDLQGSVGILFEQASSRGHLQSNDYGEVSFPFTIRNQLATSLSTLAASQALRAELLDYQAEFVRSAIEEAAADPAAGWVFGHATDRARVLAMMDVLMGHGIAVHELDQAFSVDGVRYAPDSAFYVPHDQQSYRLVRTLFERRTEFLDATFYDVSSWTLPLAFGLPHGEVSRATLPAHTIGSQLSRTPRLRGQLLPPPGNAPANAWLIPWHGHHAPRTLASLAAAGVISTVATRPLQAATAQGLTDFAEGTVIVPVGVQDLEAAELAQLLGQLAARDGLTISGLATGLTPGGIDLGSPSVVALRDPAPVLIVGSGASSYEAGEVWFQLDQRWGVPVAMIEGQRLGSFDLTDTTHVIVVSGAGNTLDPSAVEQLSDWVREGGVVIASRGGASWATKALLNIQPESDGDDAEPEDAGANDQPALTYADYESERAKALVSGTIFSATIDRTHPLGFGYQADELSLFKSGTTTLARSANPLEDCAVYTAEPLQSGYANGENVANIAETMAASARRVGAGTVIRITDNPLFRGVWQGTSKLFANAFFFGHAVKRTSALRDEAGAGMAAENDVSHEDGGH